MQSKFPNSEGSIPEVMRESIVISGILEIGVGVSAKICASIQSSLFWEKVENGKQKNNVSKHTKCRIRRIIIC